MHERIVFPDGVRVVFIVFNLLPHKLSFRNSDFFFNFTFKISICRPGIRIVGLSCYFSSVFSCFHQLPNLICHIREWFSTYFDLSIYMCACLSTISQNNSLNANSLSLTSSKTSKTDQGACSISA